MPETIIKEKISSIRYNTIFIKQKIADICYKYPALIIVLGLLCGSIPFCPVSNSGTSGKQIAVSLSLILLAFCFFKKKYIFSFLISNVVGIISAYFFVTTLELGDSASCKNLAYGAIIECQISDPKCCGKTVNWLPNPSYILAEVTRFRYSEVDHWRQTCGKTLIKLPFHSSPAIYGEMYQLQGTFMSPDKPVVPGDFNFSRYLLTRGVSQVFQVKKIIKRNSYKSSSGIFGYILTIRNNLLVKLTHHIDDVENKQILAALLFGCKQGLSWEERQRFIRSGTIHIFAISGLHVGLFALLLFWLFRWVPFSTRHLLVPAILTIYVLTIGWQPSAVRALVMISTWSVLRAYMTHVNPLNTVFFSAAIILVFSPFSFLDIGFQYSFLVTAFLVQSWQSTKKWLDIGNEKVRWIPAKNLNWWQLYIYKYRSIFLATLIATLTACLASSTLTLYYRGLFIPFALINNLFLQPFIWLVFMLCVFKMIISFFTPLSLLLAWLIEGLLTIIKTSIDIADSCLGSEFILSPPLWSIPIFLFVLAMAVCFYNKKWFVISTVALLFIMIFWHFRGNIMPGKVYVFQGGEFQTPTILILPGGDKGAILLNPASRETSRAIANLLGRMGKNSIAQMVISKTRKAYCQGSPFIFGAVSVDRLIIPRVFKRSYYAKMSVERAFENKTRIIYVPIASNTPIWHYANSTLEFNAYQNSYTARITLPGQKLYLKYHNNENGIRTLRIQNQYGKQIQLQLKNSNQLQYYAIDMAIDEQEMCCIFQAFN